MDGRLPSSVPVSGKHPRRTGAVPPPSAPRRPPGRWCSWTKGRGWATLPCRVAS